MKIKNLMLASMLASAVVFAAPAAKTAAAPAAKAAPAAEAAKPAAEAPKAEAAAAPAAQPAAEAPKAAEFSGDVAARTGVEGLEVLDDVTMVVVPDLMTTMPGEKLNLDMVKAVQTQMIAHCERCGDRVAILDTPPNMNPQEVKTWRMETTGFDSSYAAMYYPWIKVSDPATDKIITVPPSGYIAGVWARNDTTRGVHKAPANEIVQLAVGLEYQTTKGEQDTLNPNGVNCIRAFPGRGIRVWGARTLSSDPAWRYINVFADSYYGTAFALTHTASKYIDGEDMTEYGDWQGKRKALREQYRQLAQEIGEV